MKTMILEIEEQSYQKILNFIQSLPENQCRIINDNELSNDEFLHIQQIMEKIQQSDYSEFEDWETVKNRL